MTKGPNNIWEFKFTRRSPFDKIWVKKDDIETEDEEKRRTLLEGVRESYRVELDNKFQNLGSSRKGFFLPQSYITNDTHDPGDEPRNEP